MRAQPGDVITSMTHLQCVDMVSYTQKMANPALMLLFAAENVRLMADEGIVIHHALAKESGDSIGE